MTTGNHTTTPPADGTSTPPADGTSTPPAGATPAAEARRAGQGEPRAGAGDTLTVLATADAELTARLDRELTAFNNRATGADDEAELNVRVTDADGDLVAGLTGWTWGGCAGINMVWVRADRRAEGWGGRLLRAFEAEAGRRGCTEVSVSSFSFQAPEFYRRHGYLDTGRREGIPGGHVDHHFWKSLRTDPAAAVRLVALVEFPADAVEAGQRYEDAVLALLGRHGGRVERRLRTGDGRTEVHLIRFDTRVGYDAFLVDPERVALRAALGDAAPQARVLEVHEV
ncbi:GNAT family N-acetyltransferase [Micromonospora echinaurantiaca]|uniref:GNAT family N-acetyltransferase n=1 Tax=Micromonospora echinaurantiaca TaxID=47857 RepID=UPI0037175CAE